MFDLFALCDLSACFGFEFNVFEEIQLFFSCLSVRACWCSGYIGEACKNCLALAFDLCPRALTIELFNFQFFVRLPPPSPPLWNSVVGGRGEGGRVPGLGVRVTCGSPFKMRTPPLTLSTTVRRNEFETLGCRKFGLNPTLNPIAVTANLLYCSSEA